ncbi:Signal transduction histidine kinase [Variovorax sp. YR752]|uniref:ATP-binding protein n=1 Tax=Variovorax sp. YR752 TaxID=1884383 RepID=UPI000BD08F3F|nr:ATP-binding protein [Variovorax sp. YR752]SOD24710.1 Signal transduction histidine kinase [Variovorax sp. YR752]
MNSQGTARRWSGPPLAWQIMGLLLGGLVVAQVVTLALTVLLPPQPQRQWEMGDIARVLSGRSAEGRNANLLQRTLQANAPQPKGQGWLTSERSRRDLAQLLTRDEAEVRLYFFTPLPFAGATGPVAATENGHDAAQPVPRRIADTFAGAGFLRVQARGGPGGGGGGPGGPGGPGGMAFPGGMGPSGGGFGTDRGPRGNTTGTPPPPPGGTTTNSAPGNAPATAPDAPVGTSAPTPAAGNPPGSTVAAPPGSGAGPVGTPPSPGSAAPNTATTPGSATAPGSTTAPGAPGAAPPPGLSPTAPPSGPAQGQPGAPSIQSGPSMRALPPVIESPPRREAPARAEAPVAPPIAQSPRAEPATRPSSASTPPATAAAPPRVVTPAEPPRASRDTDTTITTPIATTDNERPAARGLFGLAPAPFVEGDFIAAVYTPEGSWVVVQPVPESFPNAWQRRVLLWFLIAAAIVAPAGWLFSRRLVRPIAGFARAADQLGRDPAAPVLALEGPAEIGRAAQAFNRMQARLRSFVDDRTVMIGAISHDLRTPLTRLRFRIEDVPDDVRAGMLEDVQEMELMIGSVLSFIRDASVVSARERMDLSSLVEDVVEQAIFVGKNVQLRRVESAQVEVDPIGMRRVLDNLIENAVKYGHLARVRLFTDGHDAVVEIGDRGPGLPANEIEQVFKPFYRTAQARSSRAAGSGLGLAVCRSIARAHGGDVVLRSGSHGLVAQVRVPLALEAQRLASAAH